MQLVTINLVKIPVIFTIQGVLIKKLYSVKGVVRPVKY